MKYNIRINYQNKEPNNKLYRIKSQSENINFCKNNKKFVLKKRYVYYNNK